MDVEQELDTIASGSATEEMREMARRAVLDEFRRLQKRLTLIEQVTFFPLPSAVREHGLRASIARVRKLHWDDRGYCHHCTDGGVARTHPCETLQEIDYPD